MAASTVNMISPLKGDNYPTWKMQCQMALMKGGLFSSIFLRKACLRFVVKVGFLCEKGGNVLHFFITLVSTYSQIITVTYIEMLRHTSLLLHLMNPCFKFCK